LPQHRGKAASVEALDEKGGALAVSTNGSREKGLELVGINLRKKSQTVGVVSR